jgi:hypothetical protein
VKELAAQFFDNLKGLKVGGRGRMANGRTQTVEGVYTEMKKEECGMKKYWEGLLKSGSGSDHPPSSDFGAARDRVKWSSESDQVGVKWTKME